MGIQTQELARRFIDALHRLEQGDEGDVGQLVELFSDDVRLVNSAMRLSNEERRGLDGAREFWTEYRRTFDRISSEFHQVTTNDEAAGLFWTTRGTNGEEHALEYQGASLLVFNDDGKIRFFQGYYDTRELERESDLDRQA